MQVVFQGERDGVIQSESELAIDNQIFKTARIVQLRGRNEGSIVRCKNAGKGAGI